MTAEDSHIGFLITSPYQAFHYKWIEKSFTNTTIIVEERDHSFGITEDFLLEHFPNRPIEWIPQKHLKQLDGKFDAIVCQTPILPLRFFEKTYIIAQQYSLAKETYQYGIWRSQADLNLMYGPYSVDKVSGFCNAVAVGNPLLDPFFSDANNNFIEPLNLSKRLTVLYLPTYGDLSSLPRVIPKLGTLEHDVIIKLHHGEDRNFTATLAPNCTVVYSDTDPVELLRKADCVISDYSGAAFDALYAGRPVILTQNKINPLSNDFSRLSDHEKDRTLLSQVTEQWDLETSFEETVSKASAKLNNESNYSKLIERYFVNPGYAGDACATQIKKFLESGGSYKFAHMQVRNTMKKYILNNRKLKSETQRLRSKKNTLFSKTYLRKFSRKIKKKLAQISLLKKCIRYVRTLMGAKSKSESNNETKVTQFGLTPRQRRSKILSLIMSYFDNSSIELIIKELPDSSGPVCAILNKNKKKFHQLLLNIAEDYPTLEIYLGKGASIKSKKKLISLKYSDIYDMHYIALGISDRVNQNKKITDWCLEIQFVEYKEGKFTSLNLRSTKVDWTEEFDNIDSPTEPKIKFFSSSKDNTVIGEIDAVYTWVDSSDPFWQNKYEKYSKYANNSTELKSANNEERYVNRDELKYSLRSLWMYAPFVRHVYLVTDNQVPKWLNQECEWISVVSHKEIFPDESVLPTFNSHAIESCLHRIPNLSENFIYFNDDVFLGRETTKEDFFTKSGLPKNRFSPSQYIYEGVPDSTAIPTHWAAFNANRLIQRDFGFVFDRKLKHVPFPLKKSTLREIEQRYNDEIANTRRSKFRSSEDLAIPSMFAAFYSIATGKGNEWPNILGEYIYADTGKSDFFKRLSKISKNRPKFFCINATKHREIELNKQAYIIENFLQEMYPFKGPFEK